MTGACVIVVGVAEQLHGNPGDEEVRVLIVDDNQDLAENIAEILSMRGYATEIATSAEEALPRRCPTVPACW